MEPTSIRRLEPTSTYGTVFHRLKPTSTAIFISTDWNRPVATFDISTDRNRPVPPFEPTKSSRWLITASLQSWQLTLTNLVKLQQEQISQPLKNQPNQARSSPLILKLAIVATGGCMTVAWNCS
jgi:hypothetical protein